MFDDYTTVLGVDAKHLRQLSWTWPTWVRHKPSILKRPLVIFYDQFERCETDVQAVISHPDMRLVAWPPAGVEYPIGNDKWTDQQRVKMLSGFVYVPAKHVKTRYWLKLDTDVVATGQDNWIDDSWFRPCPAIISHKWSYTKPATQMDDLDKWVDSHSDELQQLAAYPALNLHPVPGSNRLNHNRIISFCGMFDTHFSSLCSDWASKTCELGHLPVPSQDGYHWYCAARGKCTIIRTNMKARGWQQWSGDHNIQQHAAEAMK